MPPVSADRGECAPIILKEQREFLEVACARYCSRRLHVSLVDLLQECFLRFLKLDSDKQDAISHYRRAEFNSPAYRRAQSLLERLFDSAKDHITRPHRVKNPEAAGNTKGSSQPEKITPRTIPLELHEAVQRLESETPDIQFKMDCQALLEKSDDEFPHDAEIAKLLMEGISVKDIRDQFKLSKYQYHFVIQRLRVRLAPLVEDRVSNTVRSRPTRGSREPTA
jgi:hypothetical protein